METSSDHEELRGLDLVLRHVCNKPVEVSSVTNALYSLLISQRHKISRVSKICLQYLLQEVSADNVLDIIVTVASFTSLCTCPRHEGSQYDHGAAHDNEANEVLELFEDLSRSCLKTIDKNAVEVLKDEKFLLLSPKMVEFIVRRDTLCIHSEMTVIIALNKWSQYRCSLKKLEPTTRNKVKMLDGILHQVRWLTLSPFELQMSQAKFSLLSRREVDAISRVMEHSNCSCPLPARLQRHRSKMSSPRCGPQHEVCEKYQMQVATTPRLMRKMQELPPRPPPPERAFVYRLPSPAPPVSPDAWKMSLTQYRKPARYSEQVPSYEQSMLAVSRRIRNKSQPPPLPLTSSYAALRRSCSRPRTPSSGLPPFQSNYSTHNAYTKIFDHKRTPARGL